MKLIDANHLRDEVLALPNCYNGYSDTYDKSLIIGLIDEQIAVDAVPVVRCKDCEYADKEVYQNNEMWLCRCRKYSQVVEANDFCSYGERRTE